MPVIDIHPPIVSPDTQRYPLAPLGGVQSTWSSKRPTTYQDLLNAMDDAGVDKAAIVHASTAYGYDNRYVADAVAAVPSRIREGGLQTRRPIRSGSMRRRKRFRSACK